MSSTATAYRLEELGVASVPGESGSTLRQTRAGQADDTGLLDTDPVLEASRMADSTVPDGGYGWVIIAGCAIVAWWNIGVSYTWGVVRHPGLLTLRPNAITDSGGV